MKKLFMAVIALMMTISASAQFYIYYSDGTVAKVDSISMIAPEEPEEPDTPTEPEEPENPSAGIGVFSVAEGKTVTFSPGNLQYTQSTDTWSFASAQYEIIGTDNVAVGTLADKIDWFGWSTGANKFGVSISTSYSDYYGSFVDWGINKIGNDAPNTWRTLTYNEWNYMVFDRPNASSLRSVAQVKGVNGLVLLPDSWICPEGIIFKLGFHSSQGVDYYADYQTFTADQWSKLEASGAVFLPAAGYRYGSTVNDVQGYGYYWSATEYDSNYANCFNFYSNQAYKRNSSRSSGLSVRLVKDIEGEITTPDKPTEPDTPTEKPTTPYFSVSTTKFVTFSPGNLQYHPVNNEWRFAESQLDYIGTANSNISSSYNGWLDLFGWSTSTSNFGVSTLTNNSGFLGSFVDWGINKIGNDAPNTWRTLSNNEWEYVLNTRTNASSLKGVAQVNGVNGLILLPDNWTCPADVTLKSGFHSDWSVEAYGQYQTFSADQWSKLESAGAVFLPAAGYRVGTDVRGVQNYGRYWSATEYDHNLAYYLYLYAVEAYMNRDNRCADLSVRLVKDL